MRIYEKVHQNNLQVNSFHETTLIFQTTLKKLTLQEKRNQVNTRVSFRGYGIYRNNIINFATVRINFLADNLMAFLCWTLFLYNFSFCFSLSTTSCEVQYYFLKKLYWTQFANFIHLKRQVERCNMSQTCKDRN